MTDDERVTAFIVGQPAELGREDIIKILKRAGLRRWQVAACMGAIDNYVSNQIAELDKLIAETQ